MSLITLELSAQVGINNTSITSSSSAMLDVYSTDKGLLIPRLTTSQRNQIPVPATGLLIYNTTTNRFNYFNGSLWFQIETTFVTDITGNVRTGGGVSISSLPNKPADSSAMLDASDSIRGILVPRTLPGLVSAPENGLILYDVSANLLKYYFDNEWMSICGVTTGQQGGTGSQSAIGVAVNKTGSGAHTSAILDVAATDKGILIPRLTAAQRDALYPVMGLTIFNTTSKTIEYFNGSLWYKLNILLPASVTISANLTTVCAGVSVVCTATAYNGGDTPAYQWRVNGVDINGATNATYNFVPANSNVVTCVMTSSSTCVSGSPATSNALTFTVNPLLPVSATIAPSANPVCTGTSVTFTATVTNGGTTPLYQWRLGAASISGATNPTYTFNPVNGNAISCIVTSNATCATNNPTLSNTVTMTVNPLLPVSATITPSANPVCTGNTVTFTATVTNGGANPLFQWRLGSANISGATNSTYTFTPVSGNAISCIVTSNATCATNNPTLSNTVTMTVNPLLPVSASISPSANPVCSGTSVTFTASVTNGGTNPLFQWRLGASNISGATNSTYTFNPANGNAISCIVTSNAVCPTNNPTLSNTVTMTVNPLLPVSATITPTANPVCAGTQVTFSTTVTNGGANPQFQWRLGAVNIPGATNASYTYSPLNGDAISCIVNSNATCATNNPALSNTVTMTVNPLLTVGVTISGSANPVCAGTSVTFTATATNGGSNPQYQWKLGANTISGATNPTYSYVPVNGDAISCVLTSNAVCATANPATSNTVTMTVNPLLPVSATITPSANPVCNGAQVTFGSTVTNGGANPQFQWRLGAASIPGATNASYTYTPVNGDAISCIVNSNATCATNNPALSNTVTMTVNPLLTVGVTISESANPVCAGTSVTFTATATNGGSSPQYQWKLGGNNITGATSATYSYVPVNGDAISCVLTSNAVCATANPATSNTVTMTVNPLLTVGVTISESANPVCAGTSVTFTATPTNGGSSPQYQWKHGATNITGATNATYSYVPVNGDAISCVLTSNAVCATANPATSNTVTMIVNPLLPVSVSVSASANPVCAGTSVTFTATPTNGGSNPLYQWKQGANDIPGATANTYTFVPVNGDAVSCVLTSNAICTTGNPATSNTVTMTVNPLLPVSVTISASANPVCAGTSVTFTATVTNGGSTPLYQWKNGANNVSGATNVTYSYVPVNGEVLSCVVTSNATCPTGNPATSNSITMTVNPLLPVSNTVSSSANPVCAGTSVTFTSTVINGGTSPQYQWRLGSVNISGATASTYTFVPVNGNAISCIVSSNAVCATNNPSLSNTVTMTVNPLLPVSVTVSPSANPVCAGTQVTFSTTVTNGGSNPQYQWRLGSTNISGATGATYSYVPVNGDAISCIVTSNATCATNNPALSNTVTMTVNPLLPVSISISESANPVCAGVQVAFSSSVTNGGTTPQFQWRVGATNIPGATSANYVYAPVNGDAVSCIVTSNATCATNNPTTSNTVTMTVNPLLPVSANVTASANPVCAGGQVTFTVSVNNGGTSPQYQWRHGASNISGATNVTYSYVPVNGDAISCIVTSNAICPTGNPATSNFVTMTVNPLLPVSITVSPSSNPVCAGTQVTFTSIVTNGGAAPQYQWKLNGTDISGATNATFAYNPLNNDAISCVVTSNAICPTGNPATSNSVVMVVNPLLPVSISIVPSDNPVCAGTTVTFTSSIVNGGTLPQYQWKVNGASVSGATSADYSYAPVNGDQVTCVLTSNAICPTGNPASSNAVSMTVNPLLTVAINITPSGNPVCAGTQVTFTSVPYNAGTAPLYQWRLNGVDVNGATNTTFTYTPVDGDVVYCMLTSNAICPIGNPAKSNSVIMIVNPLLPVSIVVSPSENPVCAGTSVTFTSSVVNGGTLPQYQWNVNGTSISGATAATYTYVPLNGDQVLCVLTSNATCPTGNPATSNTVVMTVNPLLPVSITISASANPVCAGTTVTYSSTVVNGGTIPQYQWRLNGSAISGATNATYAYVPVNADAISCVVTSNAICPTGSPATSNTVTMTVNPLLPVSITITPSVNPVCTGYSVTFTSSIINGGVAPAYQWRRNGANVTGATTSTYTYTPTAAEAVTCVLTSDEVCATGNPATSNAVNITLTPNPTAVVTIAASANPVCAGTSVTFTATNVSGGGTTPSYQWKVNNIVVGTTSTYTYVPVNGDAILCIMTSSRACVTGSPATSNTITMTVNPLLPVSIAMTASANPVCAGTQVTFSSTIVNGGPSPQYQWKVNSTGVSGATNPTYSYVPVNNDAVYCVLTSNATCATGSPATSNTVTMTVNPLLPVSITITPSANPVCAGTSVTYTSVIVNGGLVPQYQWKLNGNDISGATGSSYSHVPVNGDAISCVLTSNAICPTGNPATSNTVTMTVNPLLPVSISISASGNPVCAGTSVTFSSSVTNGGTTPQFEWKKNGTTIAGATNATYTYVPVHGDALLCVVTSNAICPTGNPATSNTITMTVNPLLPVSISISSSVNNICAGVSSTYTSTIVNGGTNPQYQWRVGTTNISGATNSSYTYVPANNDAVVCILTSNAICPTGNPATSNTVTMVVNPLLPVSITVSPSSNPICPGTAVTFSSSVTNGGSAPTYQWIVNEMNVTGATNATYSYSVSNNDLVKCIVTSNATCAINTPATSNTVTMSVTPYAPLGVTVAAGTVVAGSPVTFTATPVNGGSSPVYSWKVNGATVGTNNPVYTYTPVINDVVYTTLTSTASCTVGNPATSNTVVIRNTPLQAVRATIAASANPVCAGASVTFTATPQNCGTTPTYQWKLGGTNITGATNATYTYTPVNLNVITCLVTPTGGGTAPLSNAITMSVIPLVPVSVSITASVYALMPGGSVTYTATPVNQGTSPSYQWKVNGTNTGTNSPVFTYTPADHDKVTCTLTSNYTATCLSGNPATSNTITMVVYMTGSPCSGTPTVSYAGLTYNTVSINTQCWLRENLNIGTRVNGSANQTNNSVLEKYCYNNDEMNCNVYGGLYQWAEMVQYLNNATNTTSWSPVPSGNVKGICPDGWHIPTNVEWNSLLTYLGGITYAGGKIKEATLAHFFTPNAGATNSSGFTELPGGERWTTGVFYYNTNDGMHWTVTGGSDPATTMFYGGASYAINAALNGQFYKTVGLSVRCLKD